MVSKFIIDKRIVDINKPPLIIAEIGINHSGNLDKAIQMIDDAKKAGCECVKFQYHIPEKEMLKTDVIPGNSKKTIWNIIKESTLSHNEELKIFNYVKRKKLIYLSTPFSKEAAIKLNKMGVKAFKIGSGECNNFPLIDLIAKFRKPIILSTGMNNLKNVKKAAAIIKNNKCNFAILHCVSLYPTPFSLLNLDRINKLKKLFPNTILGLSDHSKGIHGSLASIPLGARIIEKHFTSKKNWKGPDIPISINPEELKNLINYSKDIVSSLKEVKEKSMLQNERPTIKFAYASVVSTEDIKKGEIFTNKNIWVKRPGIGFFKGEDLKKLLGKKANQNIKKNIFIKKNHIL